MLIFGTAMELHDPWAYAKAQILCRVSVAPVSDWRLYDTLYREVYGLIDNDEGYAKSNVINQIHALKSPLL